HGGRARGRPEQPITVSRSKVHVEQSRPDSGGLERSQAPTKRATGAGTSFAHSPDENPVERCPRLPNNFYLDSASHVRNDNAPVESPRLEVLQRSSLTMKTMKGVFSVVLFAVVTASTAAGFAQSGSKPSDESSKNTPLTTTLKGVIKKIDDTS